MNNETNIDEIRNMAITFLHIDCKPVSEDGIGSMFLSHPIFDTPYQPYKENGELIISNFLEDETVYQKIIEYWEDTFRKCKDVYNVFMYIRTPYKLAFFKYIYYFLSKEDYSKLLSDVWIASENPNMDINVSIDEVTAFFKSADKKILMTEEEYDYYEKIPNQIRVYRGVSRGRTEYGLSWTVDKEKAIWFANRFMIKGKKGMLLTGIADKKDIMAYFNGRNEKELIIHPDSIKQKEEIKY